MDRGQANAVGVTKVYTATERAELIDDPDIAVFTTRYSCSRELITGAARLRGIGYPVIGVETLDLPAANELGIIVGHGAVRGNVTGMAESTVMLILMLLYDVGTNIQRMQQGLWRRPRHSSRQLEGKTIGLIGFGRIAREMTARLAPFNVRLLTASPRTSQSDLPPGVARVALPMLLDESDVVCVLTGLRRCHMHPVEFGSKRSSYRDANGS